jgi:polar amino acid transport system substrate-binding protein
MGRLLWLAAALLAQACDTDTRDLSAELSNELLPTGRLRVAVPVGPAVSATFAVKDQAGGALRGPSVDLAAALGGQLGVSVSFIEYPNSGAITAAGPRGEWDITFVPVDDTRAEIIDFGPAYCVFDSTFLVRRGSSVQSIPDLDREGILVAAIEATTTGRAAARTLQHATLQTYATVDELRSLLASGEVDAVALSRLSLGGLAAEIPGSRILDDAFHSTATAIAVPKGKTLALAYVSEFVETAKRDGRARRALDAAGLQAARVAPAAAP